MKKILEKCVSEPSQSLNSEPSTLMCKTTLLYKEHQVKEKKKEKNKEKESKKKRPCVCGLHSKCSKHL